MADVSNKKSTKKNSKTVENSGLLLKEQLIEYQNAFRLYDPENAGKIESHDLKNAMRAVGFEPKSDEIKRLIKSLKLDAGTISFDQFLEIIRQKTVESDAKFEILKAFRLFDEQGSGHISIENLRHIAKELGESVSNQELLEMIAEADLNGDGLVDEDEFYRIMKKTSLY